MLFLAILLTVAVVLDKHNSTRKSEQRFYDRFNQIPKNSDTEDALGLSLANLPVNEEKEIHNIIKKSFEGQYLYRYYHKNEKEMDKLIEDLYIPEEYQRFKKELKEEYKYVERENVSLEDISYSIEKMRFSKIGKYKNLGSRVSIVAGPESGNVHSFLFKKVNSQWKIEKEKWSMIKYFFDEHLAAKQLIEQKNNEMPGWKVYQNEEYRYELQYPRDMVEIVLDEVFERGTEGNPGFRIKTGGHFAVGVWDNPKDLTARQWIDEQYMEYSGGWFGEFKEITVGKEKAYSALITEPCYIEYIIIPREDRFCTFGVELCDENIGASLNTFKNIVDSFRFL